MDFNNPFGIEAATNAPKAGKIYLANEGAVGNQFLSQALTQFSVGWTSQNRVLEDILDMLCGSPVYVSKRFAFKKADDKKSFAAAENDEDVRAIAADFKRITVPGTTVDAHTVSKGLTMRIDRDELNDDPEAEQKAVAHLRTILLRAEIIRAFTGLSTAATNANKTWGTGDNKADADADVIDMLLTAANAGGLIPNRVTFGPTAWQKRFLTLRTYGQNTGVAESALLTKEQLAGIYGVNRVDVVNERFQSGTAKAPLITTNIVLAFTANGSGLKDDPSNIKRFVTKVAGADFAVFREERAACVDVTVAHQSLIAVTSNLGIGKLTIS